MTTTAAPPEILEKIRKLLNQNLQNGATKEEACTAMAMATKLLLKYNLELSQININSSQNSGPKILQEIFDVNDLQHRHEADWIPKLFNVVSQYNLCRVIQVIKNRKNYDQGDIAIVGEKQNIEIVYYMVDMIAQRTRIEEQRQWNNYQRLWPKGDKRNTYKRGFFIGVVEGIAFRLRQEKQELEAQTQQRATQETTGFTNTEAKNLELMVVSHKDAIQKYIESHWNPNSFQKAKSSSYSGSSREKGRTFGKTMDLHKGVGSSSPKVQLN